MQADDFLRDFEDQKREVERLSPLAVDLGQVKDSISKCAICDQPDDNMDMHEHTGLWLCARCTKRYKDYRTIVFDNRAIRRAMGERLNRKPEVTVTRGPDGELRATGMFPKMATSIKTRGARR